MTRSADIHRDDPELGRERLCRTCQEWWPEDDEFWYFQTRNGRRQTYPYCRACWSDRNQRGWASYNARRRNTMTAA
jgi:hypothetical protein